MPMLRIYEYGYTHTHTHILCAPQARLKFRKSNQLPQQIHIFRKGIFKDFS